MFAQLGAQPGTIQAIQPFTYTTQVLSAPSITASTGIFAPFTASGTVFRLASFGRYEINYQMNYPTDDGVVLYGGATVLTAGGMLPLPYTMIGKTPDGSVSGSVIIAAPTNPYYVAVCAAAGNSSAFEIPPNSSTTNQSSTTVSFKHISTST